MCHLIFTLARTVFNTPSTYKHTYLYIWGAHCLAQSRDFVISHVAIYPTAAVTLQSYRKFRLCMQVLFSIEMRREGGAEEVASQRDGKIVSKNGSPNDDVNV